VRQVRFEQQAVSRLQQVFLFPDGVLNLALQAENEFITGVYYILPAAVCLGIEGLKGSTA
jgi:hypothetical protein